ncbi:hypothetical protein C7212DRAFT_306745 [Tuber magnatum]|uniref:Uncharacterized protein n=1 Tax=Tuber magnatum TaxID=42249 RepID=A0A317T5R0_9PEZI|nr:hypothetical protein C7212DRAFT_306745 [Tuber magnatum]
MDIGVWGGALEIERKVREEIIGLDHRPVEIEVRVCGWSVEKEEERKGRVDWERFKAELKITEKNREELERLIEEVEGWIKGKIEEYRERRKWKWKK